MGLDEQLDERKVKILKAIIKNYLETGEPVGSRTISKFTDMKLSSATIRNEMADLEELGYIVQPHTSAGRIPTDKGYRLYVDDMMSEKEQNITNRENEVAVKEQELSSMKDMLGEKVEKVEELLQNVAKEEGMLVENLQWSEEYNDRMTMAEVCSYIDREGTDLLPMDSGPAKQKVYLVVKQLKQWQ